MDVQLALISSVILPFVGSFITSILHKAPYKAKAYLAAFFAFLTFLVSSWATILILQLGPVAIEAGFLKARGIDIGLLLYGDALSALFVAIAGFFGFLAILYSVADMAHEPGGHARFFALMLLFQGSMIGLFLAGNLLLLFVFWELVGLCSYGLIGFYLSKAESARASMKALMITHACGVGIILGILALLAQGQVSLDLPNLTSAAPLLALAAAMPLFLVASMAKSVQLPVHTWLPDATVAPSAVTAFLHAAAMVKAGVYLMARSAQLVVFTPLKAPLDLAMATVGAITLTVCSAGAWLQDDIKRLLAYHTAAQIGYMFLGLGIGTAVGIAGALFHFFNHAIFKGLLFLGAGCLIYAAGTKKLSEMGGLARNMPVTAACMIIGGLALAGVPPFNGFASKLLIYEGALQRALAEGGLIGGVYAVYCALALFGSAITLASVLKMLHSAFFGLRPSRLEGVREVPLTMQIPLIILAALCIILGVAPRLLLDTLINPAVTLIVRAGAPSYLLLGFATPIGFYEALILALIISISLLIGYAIYKASFKPVTVATDATMPFTGGEVEEPYLSLERARIGPGPFYLNFASAIAPLYAFMKRGGIDLAYIGLARLVEARALTIAGIAFLSLTGALAMGLLTPVLYVGTVMMLIGALVAARHRDLKSLLIAAVIVQLGDVVMELGAAEVAKGVEEYVHCLAGGLAHLVNIVPAALAMLLCIAAVASRAGSTRLDAIRGLAGRMPITTLAFIASGLALACIPPFNTWWSEYQLYVVLAEMGRWDLVVIVAFSTVTLLAAVVKGFNRVFTGEVGPSAEKITEATGLAAVALILVALCALLGMIPDPLFNWAWMLAESLARWWM